MILKRIFILGCIVVSNALLVSQNNVCMSSSSEDDLLMELNSIDKCISQKENTEVTLPKKSTKRYLRTRRTNYYHKLRKNLKAIDAEKNKVVTKEVKAKDVYLGEVTQEPVLVMSKNNPVYTGNLREVLERYVSDNLTYPETLKNEGIEGIVWTSFVIDTQGKVKNIVALGPIGGRLLEEEASKLIQSLPKFIPGKLDGEVVNVKHLMAINFKSDQN